jgi:hypothetical protein
MYDHQKISKLSHPFFIVDDPRRMNMCKGTNYGPATLAVERLRLLESDRIPTRSMDPFDLTILEYATLSVDPSLPEPFPTIAWDNDTVAGRSNEISRRQIAFDSPGIQSPSQRKHDGLVRCKSVVGLNNFD